MTAPFVLLALSAAIGLALGTSFSWFAILVPSVAVTTFCGGATDHRLRCVASNDTSFKVGNPGGPGRPKGSRNRVKADLSA
jgi:hypothetical protein